MFAVHRIDSASATNRRFEIPESFNFGEFARSAFHLVWGDPSCQGPSTSSSRIRPG